jgi:hypothetical protein
VNTLKAIYINAAIKKCDRCGGKMRILCAIHRPSLAASADNPYAPELKNHKLSGQLKDLRAISVIRKIGDKC